MQCICRALRAGLVRRVTSPASGAVIESILRQLLGEIIERARARLQIHRDDALSK